MTEGGSDKACVQLILPHLKGDFGYEWKTRGIRCVAKDGCLLIWEDLNRKGAKVAKGRGAETMRF